MSRGDLIPMSERTYEQRVSIGRKGGLVKSEKKRLACILNPLKSGRYSKYLNPLLVEYMRDPSKYAGEIANSIEQLVTKNLPFSLLINSNLAQGVGFATAIPSYSFFTNVHSTLQSDVLLPSHPFHHVLADVAV